MIKFGIVMDFIVIINIKKDISFVMLLEVQCCGYEFYYMEMNDFYLINGEVCVWMCMLSVEQNYDKWYDFIGEQDLLLVDFDVILMCKDLLFDIEFIYVIYILEWVEEKGMFIVNKLQSLCDCNEKLFIVWFFELILEMLVICNKVQLKVFWEKYGDIIMKLFDGMGGVFIFWVKVGDLNFGVIVEMLIELGSCYCMVQNYLLVIKDGDKCVLVVDGEFVFYCLV